MSALPAELQQALSASRQAWQRWQAQTAKPRETQEALLRELVRKNQDTAFGREHAFASIKTTNDYRKQVPIADYERFRPYIDRVVHGAAAMLTQEPVLMFTLTSGSTGQPKLIPVTESTRAAHTKLTQLWYGRAFADHPGCIAGKVFGLVGAAEEGRSPSGIPYGAASGLIYKSSPPWIQQAHALPYEIAEIKDPEAKYYTAMRLGIENHVSFLGTPNPSTILRLVETPIGSSKKSSKTFKTALYHRASISAAQFVKQLDPESQQIPSAQKSWKRCSKAPINFAPRTTGPILPSLAAGKAAASVCA